jgi:hypothetical protein
MARVRLTPGAGAGRWQQQIRAVSSGRRHFVTFMGTQYNGFKVSVKFALKRH